MRARENGHAQAPERKFFRQLFYFEHPHPLSVEQHSGAGHGWALEGDSGLHSGAGDFGDRHSRETLGLWGWALQGDSRIGHSRRLWGGRLWGWEFGGNSGLGILGRL